MVVAYPIPIPAGPYAILGGIGAGFGAEGRGRDEPGVLVAVPGGLCMCEPGKAFVFPFACALPNGVREFAEDTDAGPTRCLLLGTDCECVVPILDPGRMAGVTVPLLPPLLLLL